MESKQAIYNLSNRFKVLVFLSGANNERSIRIANHFAKTIKVFYITPDDNRLDDLENSNIEIYCFNGILEKLGNLSRDILINRIISKFKRYFNERKIGDHEAYFFINSMLYASLFKIPDFYGHFDFVEEMKDIYVADFNRFEMINKVKSVSTLTTKDLKKIQPYLSPVFKIFDGIEVYEQVKEKHPDKKITLGCFLEDFSVINPFYVNELAALNPAHNFIYCSRKSSELNFDFKSNIKLMQEVDIITAFDYIVFPFEKEDPYEINKIFYLNLAFDVPMLAIQSQELRTNENFVNLYSKKHDLIKALKNVESIKRPDYLQKEILKQNIDWETRVRQLESIILAYS